MLAGSSPWKALMGSCLQQRCATSQVARNLGCAIPVADDTDLLECPDSLGSTSPRPYVTCSCGQWASHANNKDIRGIKGCLSHLELFLTS